MNEPTKGDLKAQAGWALFKRSETTPEHVVALDKYRDGCESLIPYANDGTAEPVHGEVKLPVKAELPSRFKTNEASYPQASVSETPVSSDRSVREFLSHNSTKVWDGPCQHRFNIGTNLCLKCGITKRKALEERGRKPELSDAY